MELKPIASLSRDEVRDLVRVHAKLFAFRRYVRTHPGSHEEAAHAYAERHWRARVDQFIRGGRLEVSRTLAGRRLVRKIDVMRLKRMPKGWQKGRKRKTPDSHEAE